jgi:hypothetical protein
MTNIKEKTFLFDPGYAQHTTILSINLEYMYSKINQFKNLNQRKMQFKLNYPQILRMVDNNVGFCLGSLLWAAYIKSQGEGIEIIGNPCFGGTYDKEETVEEVDFSIEFFSQLKKDAKYYLGADYEVNPLHIEILNLYKDFLVLNRGFVSTKTTTDVLLPEKITVPTEEKDIESIHSKIQEVISSGKLLDLTEVLGLIYKG